MSATSRKTANPSVLLRDNGVAPEAHIDGKTRGQESPANGLIHEQINLTQKTSNSQPPSILGTLKLTTIDSNRHILSYDGQDKLSPSKMNGYQGSMVSFHDIHYEVMVKSGLCKKKPLIVLDGVSGIFTPGTMNAIMGPTGCGKSTLLDILAGRKNKQGLSGLVLIDGQRQPDNFKLMSGYVVQDDVVMGTLSVRENLAFSANLRLPRSLEAKEKADRVSRVIEELGLLKCADTKVGNEFMRGVSGGERKRTNIGMELITSPQVLFLDEPTTGLDANTAKSVMTLLQRLAESGSTIVFSIHQPRFSIYKLVNTLHLLGNGETMYFGPALQGMEFLNTLGFRIEEHDNPADFYLDVINGDTLPQAVMLDGNSHALSAGSHTHIFDGMQVIDICGDVDDKVVPSSDEKQSETKDPLKARTHLFAEAYRKSKWSEELQPKLRKIIDGYNISNNTLEEKIKNLQYHTSFIVQFGIVCGRTIKNVLRNPRTSYLQVFTMCLFATITGAIYYDTDKSCESGLQNRVGAFFFMIMNMVFGNLSAVDLFIQERVLFIHENVSGFYRVSSYFLSKIVCDVIPNRTVPVLAFSAISYWMIGFQADAGKFFFFVLNMVMTSLVASALSFVISASVRQNAIASLLISLCYVIMMVFSGLLVNIKKMGDWLKWLEYFSIFRYSLQALSINELKDEGYYTVINDTSIFLPDCSGNAYLSKQGISYNTLWDMWVNEVAMVVMAVILLILTYVQLRRVIKHK